MSFVTILLNSLYLSKSTAKNFPEKGGFLKKKHGHKLHDTKILQDVRYFDEVVIFFMPQPFLT